MGKPGFNPGYTGNYIHGQFTRPQNVQGETINKNPGNFADEVSRVPHSYASVAEAVESSTAAFRAWRKLLLKDRAGYLEKFKNTARRRAEELIETLARETGMPFWEAEQEVLQMIDVTEWFLKSSGNSSHEVSAVQSPTDTDAEEKFEFRPLGTVAVIGSFVSPCEATSSYFIPALLMGNTVVFKPSEKTPLIGQIMAECFHEAQIPAGVFNLVQGEKEIGRRLCVHEGIDAILFTGSYETGTRIKQDTLQQSWKLLALQMGGKNTSIVWEDADLNAVIRDTLLGAYSFAGQKCTSTSSVIIHEKLVEEFAQKFHAQAKTFSIGDPLDNPFMGPLIDQGSVDRYMKFLGIAHREGAEIIMRGKMLEAGTIPQGNYVTPSICWFKDKATPEMIKKSVYQQTEIMGPNLAILSVGDFESSITLANAAQYGLVASVYTEDQDLFRRAHDDLKFGTINWNRPTIQASRRLPLLGLKKSGNHLATVGEFSSRFCTYPLSSVEAKKPSERAVRQPKQA